MSNSVSQPDVEASARRAKIAGRLRVLRWVALADLLLLIALLAASRLGAREYVQVLGPLHGVNFLVLIALTATGTVDRLWGWWFPALTLLTAGPIGAFVGEWLILRRVRAAARAEEPSA